MCLLGFIQLLSFFSCNVSLLGDFNIHLDTVTNTLMRDYSSSLNSFGLQQFIDFQSHSKGRILDIMRCMQCYSSELYSI